MIEQFDLSIESEPYFHSGSEWKYEWKDYANEDHSNEKIMRMKIIRMKRSFEWKDHSNEKIIRMKRSCEWKDYANEDHSNEKILLQIQGLKPHHLMKIDFIAMTIKVLLFLTELTLKLQLLSS